MIADYKTSNTKELKKENEEQLKDVVEDFRIKYIDMVAGHTLKNSIKDLSRVLDFDRSELSRIVNNAEEKGKEFLFRKNETNNSLDDNIIRDFSGYDCDISVKKVFQDSLNEGVNFNLKKNTDKFKNIHIKRIVDSSFLTLKESYGLDIADKYAVKVASKKLGINERTIKNRLNKLDKVKSIIDSFSKDVQDKYTL